MSESATTASSPSSPDQFNLLTGTSPESNHEDHDHDENEDGSYNNHNNQRRKKATRACFHCQKAHLTCDDSRPCQRCIKRDLANSCTDGIRKKAKYLQDTYDVSILSQTQQTQHLTKEQSPVSPTQQTFMNSNFVDSSPLLGFPYTDLGFGSEAVNLEYSILSSMLQSPTIDPSTTTNTSLSQQSSPQMQEVSMYEPFWSDKSTNPTGIINSINNNGNTVVTPTSSASTTPPTPTATLSSSTPQQQQQQQQQAVAQAAQAAAAAAAAAVAASYNGSLMGPANIGQQMNNKRDSTGKRKAPASTPEAVYAGVKRPFNYAEGFHYLINYVRDRMSREDLMRISRALALFRPSFIALIMNLTEEDLIFMEKCFQRTLLEYEKLISFSGTPTVVWRRTGEIALVGKEFSLLTQWNKEMLLGKKSYIYELMDNQSAVEYWEKFATHAFDNAESAVMTTCILLTPSNRPVPCTFCFSIKRDIFDLPSVIIGNFLPILS